LLPRGDAEIGVGHVKTFQLAHGDQQAQSPVIDHRVSEMKFGEFLQAGQVLEPPRSDRRSGQAENLDRRPRRNHPQGLVTHRSLIQPQLLQAGQATEMLDAAIADRGTGEIQRPETTRKSCQSGGRHSCRLQGQVS